MRVLLPLPLLLLLLFLLLGPSEAACPVKCPNCIPRTFRSFDPEELSFAALDDSGSYSAAFPAARSASDSADPAASEPRLRVPKSGSQPPQTNTSDWVQHGVAGFDEGFDLPVILHQQKTKFKGASVFVFRIDNPLRHVSVIPPGNTQCPGFFRTSDTAAAANCLLAVNAGFFDILTGDCIGNIYSNGSLVQLSGIDNTNFGITKDGRYIIGYLSQKEVQDNEQEFADLVSGVLWLVRESKPYYCESYNKEQPFAYFVDQQAPRTVIGHDTSGRLYILVVEANEMTDKGLSIPDTAELALSYNLMNAVNLDGGGSTTVVYQGQVQNRVTDRCQSNPSQRCERKVNTIVCVK